MRIVFVTDIHTGATAEGFQMQPRWIAGTPELLRDLVGRVRSLAPDLAVVGGDIVERSIPQQIEEAGRFLSELPGRALVCLGNHDLTESDSLARWQKALSPWKHITMADALIELPECDVIGLNTYWLNGADASELHWTAGQYPRAAATAEQLRQLDEWLGRRSDRPAILAMHSQLNGVPGGICGSQGTFEPPTASFEAAIRPILSRHPRLRATLSGHCHAAYIAVRDGRLEVTGTSLTETPYQFYVLDIERGDVRVRVERIAREGGPAVVDERRWVYDNPGTIAGSAGDV